MIVAWHEVPGRAPPQKIRPVGYGMIRAGVRADAKIGRGNFECGIGKQSRNALNALVDFPDPVRHLVTLLPVGSATPDHTVPYGTVLSGGAFPGTSCLATIMLSLRDEYILRSEALIS